MKRPAPLARERAGLGFVCVKSLYTLRGLAPMELVKIKKRAKVRVTMRTLYSNAMTMWSCPDCARTFATKNQSHFCGSAVSLDEHFVRRDPHVRELFDRFVEHVQALGPVEILPAKTIIDFHVRRSFAVLSPRKSSLIGTFVLGRRVENPHFTRIDTITPRAHLHSFRIESEDDFDEEFLGFLAEAYAVGQQEPRRIED
jgi:hypothetical protein